MQRVAFESTRALQIATFHVRRVGANVIDQTKKASILAILSELSEIPGLDTWRLKAIAKLADTVDLGTGPEIQEQYCSLDWWGGAGSMADYEPTIRASGAPYANVLVRLVREFESAGFQCRRAAGWATHFEQ